MNRQNIRSNNFALARDLHPRLVDIESLKPLGAETRKHPPAQVRKLESSIQQFGFVAPILIDADGRVVAGWGLVLGLACDRFQPSLSTISTNPSFVCSAWRSTVWARTRHGTPAR